MSLLHQHAAHASSLSCPVALQASRTACHAASRVCRRSERCSSQTAPCGPSHRQAPFRHAARGHIRAAAAGDLDSKAEAEAEVDLDEEDFEFDDDEGEADAYPGLLADSVASEIAVVGADSQDTGADDSDWTEGLWGGDEARPSSKKDDEDEWEETVLNVARVTKVVKGGRQMGFRADVVVGNKQGMVGVGCASAKEVSVAVTKAARDGKKHLIRIPLSKSLSFPHFAEAYSHSAKVMLRPARSGTGVIAGGAVRVVLQMAGIRNGYGKQLGCNNKLNNARATVQCLASMRTVEEVAQMRGLSVADMLGIQSAEDKKAIAAKDDKFQTPEEVPGYTPTPPIELGINVQPRVA